MWYKFHQYALAVSGGPDSVYLFYEALKYLSPSQITILHVNHGTRVECASEALFVQNLCTQYGIRCIILKAENLSFSSSNFESKARDVRYQLMVEYCNNNNIPCLMTAHHQDDLCETIFLKLLRGSNKIILPPMRYHSNICILRPLLSLKKQTILDELIKNNYLYCNDLSNNNSTFLRNYLRNQIFPLLNKKVIHWKEKIIRASLIQEKEEDFLRSYSQAWIQDSVVEHSMDRYAFLELHEVIQYRVLYMLLNQYSKNYYSNQHISRKHIEDLILKIQNTTQKTCMLSEYYWGKFGLNDNRLIFILEKDKKNLEKKSVIVHNNIINNSWCENIQITCGHGLRMFEDDTIVACLMEEKTKIVWNSGHSTVQKILKDKKISKDSPTYLIFQNDILVGFINLSFTYIVPKYRAAVNEKSLYFILNR